MRANVRAALAFSAGVALWRTSPLQAHIYIQPTESSAGARTKYTMQVVNEQQLDAVRVEGQFPAGLKLYAFEFKPGWKLKFRQDAGGNIIGATWTGRLRPRELAEFGLLGINPKETGDLAWKFEQVFADGSSEKFTELVTKLHPAMPIAAAAPIAPAPSRIPNPGSPTQTPTPTQRQ